VVTWGPPRNGETLNISTIAHGTPCGNFMNNAG